ncbi:active breakpoint cluster region-related protein-like isoform X4 [Heterodontus francisci]|uniref:active breakpoint cluster region-related protein-like isoform X4 n=1 Tax=Heterodontus francisci TaxID=7792 RepID=UPI00355AD0BF
MDIYLEACRYLTTHGVSVSGSDREDAEDDHVFTQDPAADAVVQLHSDYTDRSSVNSGTLSPNGLSAPLEEDRDKLLQRREMVLRKMLEDERIYVSELESLLVPLRPLKAAAYTSQPVLSSQEIQTIFFKVPELYEIHKEFYSRLKERIARGEQPLTVADLFHQLVNQFGVYRAFVNNYRVAVETAEKCVQSKEQFKQIAEKMWLKPSRESKETAATTTLEALLLKPVSHVTRVTLLIRELLNNTPRDHTDYCTLEGALNNSNIFLCSTNQSIQQKNSYRDIDTAKNLQLLKDGFMVEVTENARKLKQVFLSSDLFICAKLRKLTGRQPQYKCDWYIPLEELSLQSRTETILMAPASLQSVLPEEIEEAKARLMETKIEIYLEKKHNKGLERLKRKLWDIESWLLLNSPSIPLGLQSRNGKSYLFLLSSEYELHDWRESIEKLKKNGLQPFSMTPYETLSVIHSYIGQRALRKPPLHSNVEESEERILRGTLSLRVHSVSEFAQALNVYCAFEADCNGYFEKKAQTTVLTQVKNPKWEDEIDIQLDGAQCLRILLWELHDYRISSDKGERDGGDRLIAKTQIWLDPKTLQSKEWKENVVSANGLELSCSMRYLHHSLNQLDELSGAPRGTFGVPLSIVTYRDSSRVPLIVRHCAEEVERRGLDELGIYRVSGIATDVQTLKAAFDSSSKEAITQLKDNDIHVVAGTLKLYLRELPEPLLTHELIPSFVAAVGLDDPVAKEKQMSSLLNQLPEPNLNTFLYLMNHLKTVTDHEPVNKMTMHNLATVFGPSLLRTKHDGFPMDISQEVVVQVQVVYHFLSGDTLSQLEHRARLGSVSKAT